MMNHTTKTHPRTMAQAFGPYTDNLIYCTEEEPRVFLNLTRWGFVAVCLAVVFFAFA